MTSQIRQNYKHTINACYIGYITQAVVNNFAPLLFLTFQRSYGISLGKISFLVTVNFGVQLLVDFLAAHFVDRIGYRISIVAAHILAAAGLIGLALFPQMMEDSYSGLMAAIILYAVGGGLLEVLVSPIVEACPTERKAAAMSLLHSFYCWGHMGVVILSTAFFYLFGIDQWQVLAVIWAAVPLANALYFFLVPIRTLAEEEEGLSIRRLSGKMVFWILMVLMICAGASEQAVSQWASAFAESGLHVSKSVGDLAGPCAFAFFMGVSRVVSAKYSDRISLERIMLGSGGLCVVSYLLIALSPWPVLSLAGCALCGFAVGALWPSTFSLAMKKIPGGGTAMFALAGDIGCAGGPLVVGRISGAFGDDLRIGILAALVFPVILTVGVLASGRSKGGARNKTVSSGC
ncbi:MULTISPECIES: MFS transporter [Hungatella]|uniref:MFS transporter n=1 Tax=Hungatella hathewayi TaxID=154046 RepID=A0AAW9WPJ3_9FIRM|nr:MULTISPECIES: MFS transporter [Hungatella]MCQ4832927.1 MFS transporter [Hungatella sp. SL.1.14]MUB67060.1 MFS transporter [Hungatella hathewayi]CUQ59136.1 major facilitator superfamily protein [Hungatella hathewayi]